MAKFKYVGPERGGKVEAYGAKFDPIGDVKGELFIKKARNNPEFKEIRKAEK